MTTTTLPLIDGPGDDYGVDASSGPMAEALAELTRGGISFEVVPACPAPGCVFCAQPLSDAA